MDQSITDRFRDVGLAEHRYVEHDELTYRQEVAGYVREIAKAVRCPWKLRTWRRVTKRELSLIRQADRYEMCGMQYTKIRCRECSQVFIGPRRCETRICESCARKYAGRIRRRQNELAKRLHPRDGKRLMFLTLTKKTVASCRPEPSDVRGVFKDARRLINRLWPKKHGCGAFAVFEVGKNNNLHIHVMVYGHYVPQDIISKLWLKLTGDSPVVWIKQVHGHRKCVNYLLKYITKPHRYEDPQEMAHYLNMMIGVRRIRTYGVFYNYPLARKDACPCPLCGGKLKFCNFDEGRRIPIHALFYDEAFNLGKDKVN